MRSAARWLPTVGADEDCGARAAASRDCCSIRKPLSSDEAGDGPGRRLSAGTGVAPRSVPALVETAEDDVEAAGASLRRTNASAVAAA